MTNVHTAISDRPVSQADFDSLRNDKYALALSKFIEDADTPLTIGIQGGWGTGKTSLLNLLGTHFQTNGRCVTVLVNAWEHSLFSSGAKADVALSLLQGLVTSLQKAISAHGSISEKLKHELLGEASRISKVTTAIGKAVLGLGYIGFKTAMSTLAHIHVPEGEEHQENVDQGSPAEQIGKLRIDLGNLISRLAEGSKFERIIFFVDDLDRIQPQTAIEVLDVLKNVFEIERCVFVLAIDYEVIVKGLVDKYGQRNDSNEREFRQYFDKIIQVPFSMPVSAYRPSFDRFMQSLMDRISMRRSTLDEENITKLSEIAWEATDGIPRSVKRIVNTMSLLTLMRTSELNADEQDSVLDSGVAGADPTAADTTVLFILVCIQISFPSIYERIAERPDIRTWSPRDLQQPWALNLENYDEKKLKREGFSELWQHVVLLLGKSDAWMFAKSRDVISIIEKLLRIIDELPDGQGHRMLSAALDSVAVTSVSSVKSQHGTDSVRNDEVSEFCRSLHRALVAEGIADDVDLTQCYAKRSGRGVRIYSITFSERSLDSGSIVISRTRKQLDLEVEVSVRIPQREKRAFQNTFEENAKFGEIVTSRQYPSFSRRLGPLTLPVSDDELPKMAGAFKELAERIGNRARSVSRKL